MTTSNTESGEHLVPKMAVMCCVCKKVRGDDGEWRAPDPELLPHMGDAHSHGYCPSCQAEIEGKVSELDTLPPRRRNS